MRRAVVRRECRAAPKNSASRWGSLLVGADLWGRWSRCDDDGQATRAPRNDSPRFFFVVVVP